MWRVAKFIIQTPSIFSYTLLQYLHVSIPNNKFTFSNLRIESLVQHSLLAELQSIRRVRVEVYDLAIHNTSISNLRLYACKIEALTSRISPVNRQLDTNRWKLTSPSTVIGWSGQHLVRIPSRGAITRTPYTAIV